MKRRGVLGALLLASSLLAVFGCASKPPKAEGETPAPRCEIHDVPLVEAEVLVTYGLPNDFWVDRALSSFPNAAFLFGGCTISPYNPRILPKPICSGCEVARRDFRRNYSAEWAAHMAAFDENSREFGETLEEAESRQEDREAERGDERSEERSTSSQPGD